MSKVHPSGQTVFEDAKLGAITSAALVGKLFSLGVGAGMLTAEKLTGVPVMTIFQEITKAIEGHTKNLVDNEEMVVKSRKLVEHVNYVVESLKGAEFSDDCPAFLESIKCLAALCETVVNWNGFSTSKKRYMLVSLVDSTTLAAKYNVKFSVELAAVRASMNDLLQAVNAKSFAKLGELTSVVMEGIGALHDEHVAVNLSLVELKSMIDEASVALSDFESAMVSGERGARWRGDASVVLEVIAATEASEALAAAEEAEAAEALEAVDFAEEAEARRAATES